MSRLLLILAVVIVIYMVLRSRRAAPPASESSPPEVEEMVRCVHCGVHLPRSESILSGGDFYCSDAHRRDHRS